MSKIKLINKAGRVIERDRSDYDNNKKNFDLRGWQPFVEKPKAPKKKAKK
tara:strand:+ start:70 stop:219 length:150 start_codon:yes stop_codon:yes gene_type:complete